MTIQTTYTAEQLAALKARGAQYLVVCRHSVGQHTQGEVISWHRTHDAAQRAAKPLQYLGVHDLADMLQDAQARGL